MGGIKKRVRFGNSMIYPSSRYFISHIAIYKENFSEFDGEMRQELGEIEEETPMTRQTLPMEQTSGHSAQGKKAGTRRRERHERSIGRSVTYLT
jgi:hypothetical protein